ncbi:MAG: DUF4468 domain-containing protein [Flavobacteriaceae bacterium]|nr:DUF4468 domain-containing protein [Flavobacteriaceae bacterium]
MKKIILLLAVFSSSLLLAQNIPQLKLTPNGVEPIVVEVDGLTASEIYKKALNWVQETYKNPDEVLKANITDEKIRVNGYDDDAYSWKAGGMTHNMGMQYTLEISFKDGKYKYECIVGEININGGQRLNFSQFLFKNNGDVKKTYSYAVPSLEQTMNDLSKSFYNYVSGKTSKEDSGW